VFLGLLDSLMLLCEYYDCVNENKACMDGNQIDKRSGEFGILVLCTEYFNTIIFLK
jgi:hypothetical protein